MRLDWATPEVWRSWVSQEPRTLAATETAARLRLRFRTLRSFHAARPTEVAVYYRRGIEPLTHDRWCALVDKYFLSQPRDAAVAAALMQARDVQFDLVRDGRVHFCCDRRLLEERDGYHLLFGSLSLLAVAIRIDKEFGTDFKSILRQRGEPTVFVCDVPTEMIEDDTLAQLVAGLRATLQPGHRGLPGSSLLGFHFSIPGALPAAAIVEHYRPQRVIDTVYGRHIGVGSFASRHAGDAAVESSACAKLDGSPLRS